METEVIRLLKQIEMEYEAAYKGINGLSSGTARHAFINARMENIDRHRVELVKLVGEEEALSLIVQENDRENSQEESELSLNVGDIIYYKLKPRSLPVNPDKVWRGRVEWNPAKKCLFVLVSSLEEEYHKRSLK